MVLIGTLVCSSAGLSSEGIDLLEHYVDQTSDVQTAAVASVFSGTAEATKDERVTTWISRYTYLILTNGHHADGLCACVHRCTWISKYRRTPSFKNTLERRRKKRSNVNILKRGVVLEEGFSYMHIYKQ